MRRLSSHLIFASLFVIGVAHSAQVSITIDDFYLGPSPRLSGVEKDKKILEVFKKRKRHPALFVTTQHLEVPGALERLKVWDQQGAFIANHTHTHPYYHKTSFKDFSEDFLKADSILSSFKNFKKYFRFPYLKEGESVEKRDAMRALLKEKGYLNGAVTIDASDWYIAQRMVERLKKKPKADLRPYKEYFLKHIWSCAEYYDQLAKKVIGREIKHSLLLHHNLLNALFLEDLLQMFEKKGWNIVNPEVAFSDPVFNSSPQNIPAGESLLWALAKENPNTAKELRYPAEDSEYEKDKMDKLGL